MASGAGPALAHRSVASIRGGPHQSPSPSTPHTPSRPITSAYGSPSTVRADDDLVVIELGSRHIRVGFAGDSTPKAVLRCSPEDQRRVGDFRSWQGQAKQAGLESADDYELWRYELRGFDLGLFQDRLERLLREAFAKYLLIDSRPRRLGLVLDSAVPVPLLTAVLDTVFNKFQSPTVSLMSSATMSAVAAGVRSALIVDLGWSETVVTSVYEYREVKSTRTVRAGRVLMRPIERIVRLALGGKPGEEKSEHAISFEECEDIMCRLLWCRASAFRSSQRHSAQLETVEEQDESDTETRQESSTSGTAKVFLQSVNPPKSVEISFDELGDMCERTLFAPERPHEYFDDNELPVHLLVYQHLLQLPLDIRAICMSRIIFTGGCSNILGLKERIIDEVTALKDRRGWSPVVGKGVEQLENNPKLKREGTPLVQSAVALEFPIPPASLERILQGPANAVPELDPVDAKVARQRNAPKQLQGQIRVLHSLGPWTGASLLSQLKVPAMAMIDRDAWLQQGPNGASRPSDIDVKAQQRQSMSTGGYIRGTSGHYGNWTLGTWGYL